MIRVHEVRATGRPIDEVFAYIADFSTTAEYDPGVARAVRLDPVGPGARFDVDAVFVGRTLPMRYTIVEYDPPHRLVLEGRSASSTARDEIRFDSTENGTRIDWTLDLQLLGAGRFAGPLLRPLLLRLGRKALDGLAQRLEQPEPLSVPADSQAASRWCGLPPF
jgi:carbon monoxide dehydrogenase subunit G